MEIALPNDRRRFGTALLGLRLQIRVVGALIRRETRAHFGELRLGYLWAIIEPSAHLAAYALLFTYVLKRHSPLGGNLVLFMLTGLFTYFLYSKQSTYLAGAIDENRSLLNLPPVKPFDVLIARCILEAATYLIVGCVLFSFLILNGVSEAIPYRPLAVMAVLAGMTGLGFGVGVINAIIRVFIRNWMTIYGIVLSPIFLLSGIWFLPAAIPAPYRDYLLYNPVMHYIMWARSGFYRGYDPIELDRGYAVSCSAVAVVSGLILLRVLRRKLLEPI